MARQIPLAASASWVRLELDEADWGDEEARDLIHWYGQMLLIRRFEEKLLDFEKAGLIHGPAHASIGQEAGAVGAMSALGTGDKINGTHRAHHQVLIKLVNAAQLDGFDIRTDEFTPGMDEAIYRFMAEIMGLTPGYCGGRGGSMHMRFADAGIVGSSAIVGGNPPHAVGYALADKMLGRDQVSVTFFGDGAAQSGACYEAMNIAAAQSLPVIFFIENNLYGVSTHISDVTRETRLTSRGADARHPLDRMRRHGRGGGAPCHARSTQAHPRAGRPGRDRGRSATVICIRWAAAAAAISAIAPRTRRLPGACAIRSLLPRLGLQPSAIWPPANSPTSTVW